MKQVRIYYGGIPHRNTNQEKTLVLQNFHQGVGKNGQSKEIRTRVWEPADLAVIQGWVHKDSGRTPHLMFRKEIIESQKKIGKQTLTVDSNLFLYLDPKNARNYLRFSLNDIFPSTGNYFTKTVLPERWQQIKDDYQIDLKPWRSNGNHILICLQRNGGWSMKGLPVTQWFYATVKRIRKFSDRPIVVRAHPGDRKFKLDMLSKNFNYKISNKTNIIDDLKNAWACITFNSSPGVASAIEGIPIFVTDPNSKDSQAFKVSNFDLTKIENPIMPDRQQWIEEVSMSHFNFNDLQKGIAWDIIRGYI